MPSSLDEAKKISLQKSPELTIAEIEYGQSELDVKIADLICHLLLKFH